jgi:hypothetical protein
VGFDGDQYPGLGARCHEARLYRSDGKGWGAVLHCDFDSDLPMREIHRRTEQIEDALRQHFPDLQYALRIPPAWSYDQVRCQTVRSCCVIRIRGAYRR